MTLYLLTMAFIKQGKVYILILLEVTRELKESII